MDNGNFNFLPMVFTSPKSKHERYEDFKNFTSKLKFGNKTGLVRLQNSIHKVKDSN